MHAQRLCSTSKSLLTVCWLSTFLGSQDTIMHDRQFACHFSQDECKKLWKMCTCTAPGYLASTMDVAQSK